MNTLLTVHICSSLWKFELNLFTLLQIVHILFTCAPSCFISNPRCSHVFQFAQIRIESVHTAPNLLTFCSHVLHPILVRIQGVHICASLYSSNWTCSQLLQIVHSCSKRVFIVSLNLNKGSMVVGLLMLCTLLGWKASDALYTVRSESYSNQKFMWLLAICKIKSKFNVKSVSTLVLTLPWYQTLRDWDILLHGKNHKQPVGITWVEGNKVMETENHSKLEMICL
jgi:hypothetical protein